MKLADWIKQQGVTQGDFAKRIGRSQAYVSMLCNGEVWPSHDTAAQIAAVTAGAVTANDFVRTASTAPATSIVASA